LRWPLALKPMADTRRQGPGQPGELSVLSVPPPSGNATSRWDARLIPRQGTACGSRS